MCAWCLEEVPRLTVIYSQGPIQTAYLGMSAGVEFCLDTRKDSREMASWEKQKL